MSIDSLKTLKNLSINGTDYAYFSLGVAAQSGLKNIHKLPFSLKILFENLLRHENGKDISQNDFNAFNEWTNSGKSNHEILWHPARVLMQDFTGVPAVVDLAAMRAAIKKLGGDPEKINPLSPVDLVIDHSIQVDVASTQNALARNTEIEMQRNHERYQFLRWGQTAFTNFRVVPPETGICHQVNLEYLAKCVWVKTENGKKIACPDTLVGTDSHTTMINSLGVLGWGVGGIEAEASMLGQPISMLIPEVIGVKLVGELQKGVTATDLVLTLTELLRKKGVVSKFVEYFGPGLEHLPLADRATIANMAPEYGATCGFFPIDQATINYLHLSGRDENLISLVKEYSKAQGLWRDANTQDPSFTDVVTLDLNTVTPSLAGPKRPQDRVTLPNLKNTFENFLSTNKLSDNKDQKFTTKAGYDLQHGDIAIAAITSCTNTSNPSVLVAAGLLAKNALEKGLKCKPWVKTSLAPGSQVVSSYLKETGLQPSLDALGFNLVGYGCTTCIGNSGPLEQPVTDAIIKNDLTVSAVLSGNRNFEGRIHPLVKANWLASPPLVVAFALAGTVRTDLTKNPLGHDQSGQAVMLADIWPNESDITQAMSVINRKLFQEQYKDVFTGTTSWRNIDAPVGKTFSFTPESTYIQHPPFFADMKELPDEISDINNMQILAIFGDSITTDHISPAGAIRENSPAGKYLLEKGVPVSGFNSLGARRGNHEVMMRGTFANVRIHNEMAPENDGGFTKFIPNNKIIPIYDAAMLYQKDKTPLIIIAGKEYGTGSSRDWAAKGPKLLGVAAVIAESYERIHRSNLIGMGILPLEFINGTTRKSLKLTGAEKISTEGLTDSISPRQQLTININRPDGGSDSFQVICRIDTPNEIQYYKHGGILQYVLRKLI